MPTRQGRRAARVQKTALVGSFSVLPREISRPSERHSVSDMRNGKRVRDPEARHSHGRTENPPGKSKQSVPETLDLRR